MSDEPNKAHADIYALYEYRLLVALARARRADPSGVVAEGSSERDRQWHRDQEPYDMGEGAS